MQIEATEISISFKIHFDISWYIEIWLDEQENAFINYQLRYDKIYLKLNRWLDKLKFFILLQRKI